METNSFVIMTIECHSFGHFHCNQAPLKKAPQLHAPEASVWMKTCPEMPYGGSYFHSSIAKRCATTINLTRKHYLALHRNLAVIVLPLLHTFWLQRYVQGIPPLLHVAVDPQVRESPSLWHSFNPAIEPRLVGLCWTCQQEDWPPFCVCVQDYP